MKARVKSETCQGHARCHLLCPEVFELDDEGHAFVSMNEIPKQHHDKVRQAEANCPEFAIEIDEG